MKNRLEKVKAQLKKNKVDAILISSVPNILYLTGYSGFSKEDRDCFLLITNDSHYLITHALYLEEVKFKIKNFKVLGISKSRKDTIAEIVAKKHIKILGVEGNDLTFSEGKLFSKFVKIKTVDLEGLREIKDKVEIENLRKACELSDKTFAHVLKIIKLGITEKELALEMKQFIEENGGQLAFQTVVCFGTNSSVPHHLASDIKLRKNDVVLLDFGAKWNNYCADVSRTFVFGKANKEFKKMYEVTLASQSVALKLLETRYGKGEKVKISDVDNIARDYVVEQGYSSIPHCVGHGVGLEVHEKPTIYLRYNEILEQGMVFTLEPGIYKEGFAGVRIEDVVALQNGKVQLLSKSPKHLIEL